MARIPCRAIDTNAQNTPTRLGRMGSGVRYCTLLANLSGYIHASSFYNQHEPNSLGLILNIPEQQQHEARDQLDYADKLPLGIPPGRRCRSARLLSARTTH